MKNFISRLDLFGTPVSLKINKGDQFQTLSGGVCTVFVYLVTLFLVAFNFTTTYTEMKPTILREQFQGSSMIDTVDFNFFNTSFAFVRLNNTIKSYEVNPSSNQLISDHRVFTTNYSHQEIQAGSFEYCANLMMRYDNLQSITSRFLF